MRSFADKFNIHDRQIVDNVVEVLIDILIKIHPTDSNRLIFQIIPKDKNDKLERHRAIKVYADGKVESTEGRYVITNQIFEEIYPKTLAFSVGERVHIHKLTKKLVELKNKLHGITISQEAIPPEITETIDHIEEPKIVEPVQIKDRSPDALVLHCERCSVDGTRIHEQSEIAVIDTEKLRLPLEATMFSSINPKREIPSFWKPGNTWATVRCMWGNHTPFNLVDDAMTQQRQKDGGPRRLLTNRGWIEIDEQGILLADKLKTLVTEAAGATEVQLPIVDEAGIVAGRIGEPQEGIPDKVGYLCEFCGKEFKTKANLGAHQRSHKEKK